jgi:hypothetical protein
MINTTTRFRLIRCLGLILLAVLQGCATVRPPAGPSLVPTQFQTRTGPYCVFTNTPLPADSPSIQHLQSLESQIQTTLGLRVPTGADPIEVYILESPEAFRHFLMFYFPELPARRAFFLAQGSRRVVYTYFGGRLEEDLRHEATHALLHAAAPDLPLWLDEGLAEYFEIDEARAGLNADHIARLPDDLEAGWKPEIRKLEMLKDVRKMTPRDYRESWAWVHYLLNGSAPNKALLLGYLADQRAGGIVTPLSRRLPNPSEQQDNLIGHIEQAREAGLATTRPEPRPESTIRFQDTPTEPAPPRKRGILGRFVGLFGF